MALFKELPGDILRLIFSDKYGIEFEDICSVQSAHSELKDLLERHRVTESFVQASAPEDYLSPTDLFRLNHLLKRGDIWGENRMGHKTETAELRFDVKSVGMKEDDHKEYDILVVQFIVSNDDALQIERNLQNTMETYSRYYYQTTSNDVEVLYHWMPKWGAPKCTGLLFDTFDKLNNLFQDDLGMEPLYILSKSAKSVVQTNEDGERYVEILIHPVALEVIDGCCFYDHEIRTNEESWNVCTWRAMMMELFKLGFRLYSESSNGKRFLLE